MIRILRLGVLVSICSLSLTGCLHLSKDLLPPIDVSPSPFRPFVEYQIAPDFRVTTPGHGYIMMATSNKIGRNLMDRALKRWKKQGYIAGFDYINPTRGDFTDESELRLILHGSLEAKSNIGLQILSGLTLLVVPAYGEQNVDISVTGVRFDDAGGELRANVKEGIDEWVQILLLPVSPLAFVVDAAVADRVSDHIYSQLQEQGAFDDPAPGYRRTNAAREALRD